ncbi:Hint domain-containing protein [Paracoccaceae bacterium GXU_MW_L88]
MAIYEFGYVYRGSAFDPNRSNLELGIYEIEDTATPLDIAIEDDDNILQDNNNNNGQSRDDSQQVLAEAFDGKPIGTGVYSRVTYEVEVTTPNGDVITGEANQIVVGGTRYTAFQFAVEPGSTVNFLSYDIVGDTPFDDFVCFAAGTMIETDTGARPVETLAKGDRVMTLEHGPQAIKWTGQRHFSAEDLATNPDLTPIRIRAGALGPNLPARDLLVSPQHRILLRSKIVARMFDGEDVLIPAKKLLDYPGIEIADDVAEITYVHFLCDQHEVVTAEGALAETLYLGPQALDMLGQDAVHEILTIFPDLTHHLLQEPRAERPPLCKPVARGKRQAQLVKRHLKNPQQPLLSL